MTAPQLTSEAPPPRTRGRERLVDGKLLIGIGAVALLLVLVQAGGRTTTTTLTVTYA